MEVDPGLTTSALSSRRRSDDSVVRSAKTVAYRTFQLAAQHDHDDAFPDEEVRMLKAEGLLLAPFPFTLGGVALGYGSGGQLTLAVLKTLGQASLPLGRLFEGHVNAVGLVSRYGTTANLELLREEAEAGRLTGVWMAEKAPGLSFDMDAGVLKGAKIYCSGAGHIRRPLVAAVLPGAAGPQMVIPYVPPGVRSNVSAWRALGMKASATGDVDFDGLPIGASERVGAPNDYYQSPHFRGGAWRVLAVQLGGLEALFEQYRTQLEAAPTALEGLSLARFGEAAEALETARLWVGKASTLMEVDDTDPLAIDAYVDLARGAFEKAAWALMERVQRGLGLRAMISPNPVERILRDLTTYLRQPALDMSLISAADFILKSVEDSPIFQG